MAVTVLDSSSSPTLGLPRGQGRDWRSRCTVWVNWNRAGDTGVTAAPTSAASREGRSAAAGRKPGGRVCGRR
jgi:hypothetical protein